ncbi:hypothetical protein [Virgibacillus sediminis]|uniref:Uncharacterized protein n=1 Tax=Virgibacillus sediminis TaxID=202260 RepID=A0ABV7A1D8_9BACI
MSRRYEHGPMIITSNRSYVWNGEKPLESGGGSFPK